jgi:hypothetical protein
MQNVGFDTVYLQQTQIIHWKRNGKRQALLSSSVIGKKSLAIASLGLSTGTNNKKVTANVIETKEIKDFIKYIKI